MKTIITAIICICTATISNAQNSKLNGDWNISEFKMTNNNISNVRTESDLKEEKAIWGLFFMDNNQFKQSSNMHSGKTESQTGTWVISNNKLTLNLEANMSKIQLIYTYEIQNEVLILKRRNPSGTMEIIVKFIRKA